MDKVLSDLVATLASAGAPMLGTAIGTAIGGPAGAVAGGVAGKALEALADALGTHPTPEAVTAAIGADSARVEKITRAEIAAAPAIRSELAARLADVQDARAQTVALATAGSPIAWSASVVSVIVLAGFCGVSLLALQTSAGSAEREVMLFLLGAWLSLATAVVSYWLGSSAGSKEKTGVIEAMISRGMTAPPVTASPPKKGR